MKDETGNKYGRLTVISFACKTSSGSYKWNCICECGEPAVVSMTHLRSGHTKSCGCLIEHHGMSKSPTYKSYSEMFQRCQNPNNNWYKEYGQRGIAVCQRWSESFENFLEDMGRRPDGHSLDRINNAGNYEPSNCKWSTAKQQARNRRNNRIVTYQGVNMSLAEACEKIGIGQLVVGNRLRRGWDIEDALHTPLLRERKCK